MYRPADYEFLQRMLFEAVFWSRPETDRPTLEEGLSYDYTRHILEGFDTREGDLGIIVEMNGIGAGAAFIRYWDETMNMRGYMTKNIPVLVIGVEARFRRQGLASNLILALRLLPLLWALMQLAYA